MVKYRELFCRLNNYSKTGGREVEYIDNYSKTVLSFLQVN